MPFIHIPLKKPVEIPAVLRGINRDTSEMNGIERMHLHATWDFNRPGRHPRGDSAPAQQPEARPPIVVDLLAPSPYGGEL